MPLVVSNALAAVAVRDLATSAQWYEDLLGRNATAKPMDGLQEWEFPAGGWIQLYEKAEHAGHCAVTLVVQEIAAVREWLDAHGYADVESMDSDTASIAILPDPDGNHVVFAQSMNSVTNPSVTGWN